MPSSSRLAALVRKPHVWCFTTYFAEGVPYMIVRILSSVFFTDIGAKERTIGYLNFLGIPWNLKFLWAPFVDIFGSKRQWQVLMQLAIAALTLVITAISALADGTGFSPLILISSILILMAFISATNDIAIDAYYIEGLPTKEGQALFSGYRVLAYRLSMVFVRTGLVALVAVVAARLEVGRYLSWASAFGAAGLTMLALGVFHALTLPRFEADASKPPPTTSLVAAAPRVPPLPPRRHSQFYRTFVAAFASYFRQEKIAIILAFLLVYKLGDEILFSMVSPFMLRELGLSKAQFAWMSGIVGAGGNIAGAMLGGIWIKRTGLKRALLPITLLMNVNIWAYIALAYFKPGPGSWTGLGTIALIHGYEQLSAGLGSSALLLFLLTTYSPEYKAAHYALGSAVVSMFSHVFTGFAGVLLERMGYFQFYVLAFLASIPSLVLLFFVPIKESGSAPASSSGRKAT